MQFRPSWRLVLLCSTTYLSAFCQSTRSVGPVNYWQRGFEISSWNSGFIYLFLQFYQFLYHVFWCSTVRHIHIKDHYVCRENWPLYHYVMLLLSLIFFFGMKSALSEINIATPAFFWFMLAWYASLYPFTFHLSVFLYLK